MDDMVLDWIPFEESFEGGCEEWNEQEKEGRASFLTDKNTKSRKWWQITCSRLGQQSQRAFIFACNIAI